MKSKHSLTTRGRNSQNQTNTITKKPAKKRKQKKQRKMKVLSEANQWFELQTKGTSHWRNVFCNSRCKPNQIMLFSGILAFCVLGTAYSAPGKLPDTFPQCRKHDPKIDECLKNAIQISFPQLSNGIPSLGIFPTDPLKITALDITQGTGPVAIDLKFSDLEITGLKNSKITNVKSDLDNYIIEIQGYFDEPIYLNGKYEIKGNVLVLPLVGKGNSHLTLDNVKASIKIYGKELKKDGKSYMQVDKLDFYYDTSKLTMNFENLFSQDKALADNLNTFLNENWQELHKEVKPAILEAFGAAFKAIASRILSKVPYDEIFLP